MKTKGDVIKSRMLTSVKLFIFAMSILFSSLILYAKLYGQPGVKHPKPSVSGLPSKALPISVAVKSFNNQRTTTAQSSNTSSPVARAENLVDTRLYSKWHVLQKPSPGAESSFRVRIATTKPTYEYRLNQLREFVYVRKEETAELISKHSWHYFHEYGGDSPDWGQPANTKVNLHPDYNNKNNNIWRFGDEFGRVEKMFATTYITFPVTGPTSNVFAKSLGPSFKMRAVPVILKVQYVRKSTTNLFIGYTDQTFAPPEIKETLLVEGWAGEQDVAIFYRYFVDGNPDGQSRLNDFSTREPTSDDPEVFNALLRGDNSIAFKF